MENYLHVCNGYPGSRRGCGERALRPQNPTQQESASRSVWRGGSVGLGRPRTGWRSPDGGARPPRQGLSAPSARHLPEPQASETQRNPTAAPSGGPPVTAPRAYPEPLQKGLPPPQGTAQGLLDSWGEAGAEELAVGTSTSPGPGPRG